MAADEPTAATVAIADLANLVGRLAFLVQNEIGVEHATEIQHEADAIRDALEDK